MDPNNGQGDPGPSSMAQQAQYRPPYPGQQAQPQAQPGQMNMAMLQQMAQAQGVDPQTLLLAMRQHQQQQQQLQKQQQQPQHQVPPGGPPGQYQPGQPHSNPAQLAFQQQQIARILQLQGRAAAGLQGGPNSPARPPQPPAHQHTPQRSMPPPPLPGTPQHHLSFPPPEHSSSPMGQLTPQQQQQFLTQRSAFMNSAQFNAMPQQQQSMLLQQQQAHFMRNVMMQNAQNQSPSQPQPQGQGGMVAQSPIIHRQPTPSQMGTPQQPPLSSLPQHMAPPRPGSSLSQRPGSPHQGHSSSPAAGVGMMGTPPAQGAGGGMYQHHTPQQAPSPTLSVHSHHTPQQGASPMMGGGVPFPGAPQAQQGGYQGSFPVPSQGQGQGGLPPPPQGLSGVGLQYTTQQQQQMASALGFMSKAVQAQQHPPPPSEPSRPPSSSSRPSHPQTPQASIPQNLNLPNLAGITPPNHPDFPFDARLLPYLPHANNPSWKAQMAQQNPQLAAAVQHAWGIVQRGGLTPEMGARMQQAMAALKQAMMSVQQGQGGMRRESGGQGQGQGPSPAQGQQALHASPQTAQPQAKDSPASHVGALPMASPALMKSRLSGASETRVGGARDRTPSISGTIPPPESPASASAGQGIMAPPSFIPSHGAGKEGKEKEKEKETPPGQDAPLAPAPGGDSSAPAPASTQPAPVPAPRKPSTSIPKEWETHIPRDVPITRIIPIPIPSSSPHFQAALPPLSPKQITQVREWIDRDVAYVEGEKKRHPKTLERLKRWAEENDKATEWWMLRKGEARVLPQNRLRILWPADKDRLRGQRSHRGRKQVKFSQADFKRMAEVEDHVVPVRLDLEEGNHKLKDTFVWNCADTVVTPELFAQTLCDDFGVPHHIFAPRIITAINERVHEYKDQVLPLAQRHSRDDCRGKLDPEGDAESKALCEVFRRAKNWNRDEDEEEVKTDPGAAMDDEDIKIVSDDHDHPDTGLDESRPWTLEEAMSLVPENCAEELRILIKLDILIGAQSLTDSFEWDLGSTVTPEEFAGMYVTELGLSLEFATAIAHDVREQIVVHQRSLFIVGHTSDSGVVLDDEVRSAFLPPITNTLRREDIAMASYTPIFNELENAQLANLEAQREKEAKRKKRHGRARRGVVMPDREPIKTHRTLLNNIKPNGVALLANVDSAPKESATLSRRRGAALAAEANINLLAQDLPLPAPPSPAPPPPVSSRSKRNARVQKGGREESVANGDTPVIAHLQPPAVARRAESMEVINGSVASPAGRRRANHSRIPDSPSEPPTPLSAEPQSAALPPAYAAVPPPSKKRKPPTEAEDRPPKTAKAESPTVSLKSSSRKGQTRDHGKSSASRKRRIEIVEETSSAPEPSASDSEDSASDSASDDSDSSSSTRPKKQKKKQNNVVVAVSGTEIEPTPGPRSSVRPPSVTVRSSPAVTETDIPDWAAKALADTRSRYLKDDFVVIKKPRQDPAGPIEWRVKCNDCPGKIYTLGPGETLNNFEVHLKNKAHMNNRAVREGKANA
ncbi:hypothetical protein IAR50_000038 [Cryptococcus sp. DSM 104548]